MVHVVFVVVVVVVVVFMGLVGESLRQKLFTLVHITNQTPMETRYDSVPTLVSPGALFSYVL